MIKRIATGKTVSVTAIAVVALIAAFAIVLVNRAGGEASPSELPSMTLVYEVYGPAVTVGQNAVDPYKETRRLEYRSKSDWTETVIESPTIDLAIGIGIFVFWWILSGSCSSTSSTYYPMTREEAFSQ